jgi:S1-C subfamily serine protease
MIIDGACVVTRYNGKPSTAEEAGVMIGSVIQSVNGEDVSEKTQIVAIVQSLEEGQPIVLRLGNQ